MKKDEELIEEMCNSFIKAREEQVIYPEPITETIPLSQLMENIVEDRWKVSYGHRSYRWTPELQSDYIIMLVRRMSNTIAFPRIAVVKNEDTGEFLVADGMHRLITLLYFLRDGNVKAFGMNESLTLNEYIEEYTGREKDNGPLKILNADLSITSLKVKLTNRTRQVLTPQQIDAMKNGFKFSDLTQELQQRFLHTAIPVMFFLRKQEDFLKTVSDIYLESNS